MLYEVALIMDRMEKEDVSHGSSSITSPLTPIEPDRRGDSPWIYLVAAAFMMLLGVVAVLSIIILRPGEDNAALIIQVIGFLTTSMAGTLAFIKGVDNASALKATAGRLQEVHLSINSRFDRFAEQIRDAAFEEGKRHAEDVQKLADERVAVNEAAKAAAVEAAQRAAKVAVETAAKLLVEHMPVKAEETPTPEPIQPTESTAGERSSS
jgi:hypothetical protein